MFFETGAVRFDGIFGHMLSFFEGLSLSHAARECWDACDKSTFFGLFIKDGKLTGFLFHGNKNIRLRGEVN